MTPGARTFRVFVSSTFSDLVAERNALQERVFPKLRDLAERHGCRFQAIDLRWGVSEEAGLDHRAMRICLDELARCQRVSPRPSFIVLLGDRYGWRPPPAEVPAGEFERLRERATDGDLLDAWYKRDDNAVPPVYVLKPRTGEYEKDEAWGPVEQRLRRTLLAAAQGLPELERLKYEASATEQEIRAGALAVADAHEHVFAFFREVEGQAGEPFGEPDEEARRRQANLKAGLWDWLRPSTGSGQAGDEGRNVTRYKATWTGNGITTDHLAALCTDVEARLTEVIEREAARLEKIEPVEAEAKAHEEFRRQRARVFIGREEYLTRIEAYLRERDRRPLALWGESGTGKSALLAKAIERAPEGAVVVERFIGATAASSDIRSLLEGVCREVSHAYGDATPVPLEYREIVSEFPKRLALATAQKPLIVFIDALDQLSPTDGAHTLAWLPREMPEHVRMLVSTLPGACLDALSGRLAESSRVELRPMAPSEGRELLARWLAEAGRKLTEEQERDVLSKFDGCRLPLYLKLAFEEARRWRSYDGLPKGADDVPGLSSDIPGVLRDLFARLSEARNHGPLLVSRALGYLAAARSGLTEDELLDVLTRDGDVMEPLYSRWKLPQQRLPVVVWSRLYYDLEPYLTERAADGARVMAFYHRQVGEAAAREFLKEGDGRARHAGLAAYFESQPLWQRVGQASSPAPCEEAVGRQPNRRKVSEQPYQETHGSRWEGLEKRLTDVDFVEAKCTAGMAHDLVADYARVGAGRAQPGPPIRTAWLHERRYGVLCPFCLAWSEVAKGQLGQDVACPACGAGLKLNPFSIRAEWTTRRSQRKAAAGALAKWTQLPQAVGDFGDFVRGRVHVLARSPELTLEQATNGQEGTAPARTARAHLDAGIVRRPCVEWVNRPRGRSACLMTLAGHSYYVMACAYSPDGRRVVSGSLDKTLKVWDVGTRTEVARFPCNGAVHGLALDASGLRVVAGDKGGIVYLLRLHGINPGPPILTPVKRGGKLRLRCPFCRRGLIVPEKALGKPAKTACCQKPIVLAPTFCDADRPLPGPKSRPWWIRAVTSALHPTFRIHTERRV